MAMHDLRNATRWINTIHEETVDGVRLGKLGLRLVAFSSGAVREPTATERGKLVESGWALPWAASTTDTSGTRAGYRCRRAGSPRLTLPADTRREAHRARS
jgi:hypothetical protein